MRKFHIGQIIRRKHRYGVPIGPYMIVQHIEDDRIYASVIGADIPNMMILKDNVYVYKTNSVCISEDLLNRLKSNRTICLQHKATKHWQNIFDNPPEIIRFYTLPKKYEACFVVENVRRTTVFGEPTVQIVVSNFIV